MKSRIANRFHGVFIAVMVFGLSATLNGCGDRTQIEDRDFIMALSVSYVGNQYKVTFERPDLSSQTGQPAKQSSDLIVSYAGNNFTNIEEQYARNSKKRLDYSHLKAIIIDTTMGTNLGKMNQFLAYVADNYEISRNTMIFYDAGSGNEITAGLGENLEKIYENNPANMDVTKVTIGDMINCLYQKDKVLVLPQIQISKKKIELNGGGVFQGGLCVNLVTEEEMTGWNLLQGKGDSRYVLLNEETNLKIKKISVKYQYTMSDGVPNILIYLYGIGELIQESPSTGLASQGNMDEAVNQVLTQKYTDLISTAHSDILNLYRKMSYCNPLMWKAYCGKQNQFLQDVSIHLNVDMKANSYE